jgi:hypothetical protein
LADLTCASRFVSIDFDHALYERVFRAEGRVMAELLGSAEWLSTIDIEGNSKRVVVVNK